MKTSATTSEIPMLIRDARQDDVPSILAIFNHVIATSTAVYCDDPVTLEEREAWFAGRRAQGFPVIVAEEDGRVIGYASYGVFRGFPGFRFTVEHSVHLAEDSRGKGLGARLLTELEERARQAGMHVMVGGIDAANEGSIRFHRRLGYAEVARMPEVGIKFGRWLDLVFMQKRLS
ncbi:GNAT family N-acetyltransferase [Paludibacterium paludis]|uniref:N-acetyltransferase n=1 Tax=Paludibacterium paludis TaxID=1225769 RepID=A0A918P2M2_9NEIS|nr:GNAT family N-acetyltransferase [Paludibacterium paludis]GGY12527.1 N-acetyltransferase [Paludibacterium paludis]